MTFLFGRNLFYQSTHAIVFYVPQVVEPTIVLIEIVVVAVVQLSSSSVVGVAVQFYNSSCLT